MATKREKKLEIERNRKGPVHPAELLREWAAKNNKSINDVAEGLGIGPAALSPMINKKRRWSDPFMEKVAALTRIDVEELVIMQYRYDKWFRIQMGED